MLKENNFLNSAGDAKNKIRYPTKWRKNVIILHVIKANNRKSTSSRIVYTVYKNMVYND